MTFSEYGGSKKIDLDCERDIRVTDAVVHFGRMHAHAMARPKQLLKASANAGRFPAGVSWTRDDTPANAHRTQVAADALALGMQA